MSFSLIRRSTASDYMLLFLISAAVSVLGTRLTLYLLNYPQISPTAELHIAHTLLGGIFLTASNIMLFTFHGRRLRQISAVIGGFGMGQFIDEIGKYITRDNNYFFQPAVVIIYLVFICLFFLYRHLENYTPRYPKEVLYDLLEYFEQIYENNLRPPTRKSMLRALKTLLDDSEKNIERSYGLFAESVLKLVEKLPTSPPKEVTYVDRIRSSWHWLDEFTTERRPIFYFLLSLFLLYTANTLFGTITFLWALWARHTILFDYQIDNRLEWFMIAAQFTSQIVAALIMIRGLISLVRRHRIKALELFRTGLAVNLLLTYIFTLYFEQFSAMIGLLITMGMFVIVHNILEDENN